MSRSKVKVTRDKRAVHSHHPLAAMEWKALTANISSSRRDYSIAAGGDFGGLCAVYVW